MNPQQSGFCPFLFLTGSMQTVAKYSIIVLMQELCLEATTVQSVFCFASWPCSCCRVSAAASVLVESPLMGTIKAALFVHVALKGSIIIEGT